MRGAKHILAIDQGTTSTRAIIFDVSGNLLSTEQKEFTQIFPRDGWVEHDPEEIWQTTLDVVSKAIANSDTSGGEVVAIGISNQRETTVVWDRVTGQPIYNAIVWQDRRTADVCERLRSDGYSPLVGERTGLLLDPYFSGTKIAWILDNVEGARPRALAGELAFGTTDCFLLWRLTGGKVHATDATNASRTMLFDIHQNRWDQTLLSMLDVPDSLLPQVKNSADEFGECRKELFGRAIPIRGIAGDQQAAAIGQACFEPGMIKSTYGTGCFVLVNTGERALVSRHRLLTTIAYRLQDRTSYALEGSIFVAGAAVQWLRDGIRIIDSAMETEALAGDLDSNHGVYLVPAFTGLGAPHWDPHARAAIFGLTRDTGIAELVRATLESVCYQTNDLINAMREDGARTPSALRVDGGMVANNWLMQFLADVLDVVVERPVVTETSALGAAYLAGLQTGLFDSLSDLSQGWRREKMFTPALEASARQKLVVGWEQAIARVLMKK